MKPPSRLRSRWFAPGSDDWDLAYLGWGVRFYGLYPSPLKNAADLTAPRWSYQLVKSGTPILNLGHRTVVTSPGDFFIFGHGFPQGWGDRGERRSELLTWIWNTPPRCPACAPKKGTFLGWKLPHLTIRQLLDIHARCRKEVVSPDELTSFALEHGRLELELCLSRLKQAEPRPPPAAHRLELAIRWMNNNLPVRNPVASLCDYLQISPSSLERLFFDAVHELPGAYFLRLKMEHAKTFLRGHQVPVKEIAYILGYTHPNDFTRAYRNFTGKPPMAERKRAAARKAASGSK